VSGKPQELLVERLGYSKKVYYSYSVGLLDFQYPPILKEQKLNSSTKFLFIGRFELLKGSDLLLNIFHNKKDSELHIVGDFKDGNKLTTRSSNIFYHGYKKRDDLKEVFSMTDVLILPSRHEPWGLVVEEALYHGLPVLVSNKVGCRIDIVEYYNVGEVFDIESINEFSKKITELCEPKFYNYLVKNISKIDFDGRRNHYCNTFLND
jgi:glycosyltransferase involved in cell wall biosynthesis